MEGPRAASRLRVLNEREVPVEPTVTPPQPTTPESEPKEKGEGLLELLALLLSILGQRTLAVAGHLFPLFALAGGFYLWRSVLPNPSPNQLVGLGIYGAFALLFEYVRKRK